MKFSVVTPSFNQSSFIRQTLESVLDQTYHDVEYIVVDGGSSDGSVELIREFAGQLDKIIVEPDDGQADAINKGLAFSTGDILAYLNSDDYYFRDTIEKVAKAFELNPNIDVIYGDCVFTDVDGQFLQYFTAITDFDREWLLNNSDIIMQPATFWRRQVFEKYGPFDQSLHYGFDWAFWCELASQGCRFLRLDEVLAANRVYGSTKTSSGSHKRLIELKKINQKYKTKWLPHAYYCFSLVEYLSTKKKRVIDYLAMMFYLLMSYENVLGHIVRYKQKILYGVLPKSRLLMKQARIKLPRLSYDFVEIVLESEVGLEQSVRIFSNGEFVGHYEFLDGVARISFPLSTDPRLDIDVKLDFDKEYPFPANVFMRMLFFYKPKNISAVLSSFCLS